MSISAVECSSRVARSVLPSARTDTLVAAGMDRFVVETTRESTHGDTELLSMHSAGNWITRRSCPGATLKKFRNFRLPTFCVFDRGSSLVFGMRLADLHPPKNQVMTNGGLFQFAIRTREGLCSEPERAMRILGSPPWALIIVGRSAAGRWPRLVFAELGLAPGGWSMRCNVNGGEPDFGS